MVWVRGVYNASKTFWVEKTLEQYDKFQEYLYHFLVDAKLLSLYLRNF